MLNDYELRRLQDIRESSKQGYRRSVEGMGTYDRAQYAVHDVEWLLEYIDRLTAAKAPEPEPKSDREIVLLELTKALVSTFQGIANITDEKIVVDTCDMAIQAVQDNLALMGAVKPEPEKPKLQQDSMGILYFESPNDPDNLVCAVCGSPLIATMGLKRFPCSNEGCDCEYWVDDDPSE